MSFVLTDANLPATLNSPPMSDDEFAELSAEHSDLMFEANVEGELLVMAPTFFETGASNYALAEQFGPWARKDGRGVACDSSTGYVLPSGTRRSPDVSWTLKERISKVRTPKKRGFLRLCPDFVIELRSDTDRLKSLQDKMREYIANGAQLGWLIDPTDRSITIYRPNTEPETRTNINSIAGENPIAGFNLELETVWNPLGD